MNPVTLGVELLDLDREIGIIGHEELINTLAKTYDSRFSSDKDYTADALVDLMCRCRRHGHDLEEIVKLALESVRKVRVS